MFMMTKLDRDRDDLFNTLRTAADDFRRANAFFPEDPVTIDVPVGMWHLITPREVAQLKVFNIHVSHKTTPGSPA